MPQRPDPALQQAREPLAPRSPREARLLAGESKIPVRQRLQGWLVGVPDRRVLDGSAPEVLSCARSRFGQRAEALASRRPSRLG